MADFVLDSSMAAAWLLPDEDDPFALELLATIKTGSAVAPYLLVYEVRNLLVVSTRRSRVTAADADRLLGRYHQLGVSYVEPSEEVTIGSLAAKHGLTAYDATFIALAIELNLPLATFDKKMRAAAQEAGVAVMPLAGS